MGYEILFLSTLNSLSGNKNTKNVYVSNLIQGKKRKKNPIINTS